MGGDVRAAPSPSLDHDLAPKADSPNLWQTRSMSMGACTPCAFAPVPEGERQLLPEPKEPRTAQALCLTLTEPQVALLKVGFSHPAIAPAKGRQVRSPGVEWWEINADI